jgi:hypothetical protein
LQSTADPGVHHILDDWPPAPPSRSSVTSTSAPSLRCARPLEDTPHLQPARHSRSSPGRVSHVPSLPPRRCSRWLRDRPARRKRRRSLHADFVHPSLDLEVLLRRWVCCHRSPLPTTSSAVLPWASETPLSPNLSARPPDDVVAERLAAPKRADNCWVITSKNCTKVSSPR